MSGARTPTSACAPVRASPAERPLGLFPGPFLQGRQEPCADHAAAPAHLPRPWALSWNWSASRDAIWLLFGKKSVSGARTPTSVCASVRASPTERPPGLFPGPFPQGRQELFADHARSSPCSPAPALGSVLELASCKQRSCTRSYRICPFLPGLSHLACFQGPSTSQPTLELHSCTW